MYKIYCYTFIPDKTQPQEVFAYISEDVDRLCPDFKTWKHYPAIYEDKKTNTFKEVEWQYVKNNVFVRKVKD